MAERHFRELNPLFEPEEGWRQSFFDAILNRPKTFAKRITHEGERVGFVLYGLKDHPILPRTFGTILELYVSPDFRRMGLAKLDGNLCHQGIASLFTFEASTGSHGRE